LRFILSVPDALQRSATQTKKVVAKYDFDLVSTLVNQSTAFYGFLPVLSVSAADSTTKDLSNDIYGWIFVGFKFLDNAQSASNHIPNLSVRSSALWTNVINSSSGMKWGLTSSFLRTSDSLRPSEKFLIDNNSTNPTIASLHIALADLQLTTMDLKLSNTTKSSSDPDNHNMTSSAHYLVRINSIDQVNPCMEISGELLPSSKSISWSQEDLVLSVVNNSNEDVAIIIEIALYKLLENPSASVQTELQFIGECKIQLPKSEIQHGMPINFMLPLRDMNGFKAGTLSLSAHASNVLANHNSTNNNLGATGADTLVTTQGINNNEKFSKYLKIEYLEGNLSGAQNPSATNAIEDMMNNTGNANAAASSNPIKSVYFESKINFQNNPNLFQDWITRSGYINLSASNSMSSASNYFWNSVSRVSLPDELFSILEKSNNLESVSLMIECKDATRLSGTTFGRAAVSIPIGLFRNPNKGFEQWITISRASWSNNMDDRNKMMINNDRSPIGRVHIRLSLQRLLESGFPSLEAGQGIGIFSCLINGINTSKSPPGIFENAILSANLGNSILIKNSSEGTDEAPSATTPRDDENGNVISSFKIDQKICYPLYYGNNSVLSMFLPSTMPSSDGSTSLLPQGILGANTPVFTGHSELSFDVKTDSSINSFRAAFPLMKIIPKVSENNDFLEISPLILSLAKKTNLTSQFKKPDDLSKMITKIDPKISISGCFIPFVEGKLFIQVDSISPASSAHHGRPESDNLNLDSIYYLLRFSVGLECPRFVYTDYYVGNSLENASTANHNNNSTIRSSKVSKLKSGSKIGKSNTHNKNNSKKSPPKRSTAAKASSLPVAEKKPPNIVSLNIHTRDLLIEEDITLQPQSSANNTTSNSNNNGANPDRKNLQVLMPLILHASCGHSLDTQSAKDTYLIDEDNDDNILVGICYTAPLYIDALRKVSAEGKAPSGNDNDDEREDHDFDDEENKDSFSTSKNTINLNWRRVQMDLYEKRTRRLMATVQLRLAFKIEHVPHYVSEPIQRLFYGSQTMNPEMARLELGLKQAFTMADVDKSHFVSSDEVSFSLLFSSFFLFYFDFSLHSY
jgi:hypothetical protein